MTMLPKWFWQKVDNVLLTLWNWWFPLQKATLLQKVPLTVEEDSFDKPTEKFLTKRSIFSTGSMKLKKNLFSKKFFLFKFFWTYFVQIWKPRYLIFAKRPNVNFHSVKIIKEQFWKSKFSYSNCFFSDDDCKFGTHAGKCSAEAEIFSLEVQKWLKKDFFRRSLFFQMFNKSIGHVEYTFGCHAKKIPQRNCSFFAKRVTLIRKCFWKEILFLKLLI